VAPPNPGDSNLNLQCQDYEDNYSYTKKYICLNVFHKREFSSLLCMHVYSGLEVIKLWSTYSGLKLRSMFSEVTSIQNMLEKWPSSTTYHLIFYVTCFSIGWKIGVTLCHLKKSYLWCICSNNIDYSNTIEYSA
jgi:hypothetical protein